MDHKAFGLRESLERSDHPAKIFGEAFQLEKELSVLFDGAFHLDGYMDPDRIEHIRMYRTIEVSDPTQHWELLRYEEEEAPLELFMVQNDL